MTLQHVDSFDERVGGLPRRGERRRQRDALDLQQRVRVDRQRAGLLVTQHGRVAGKLLVGAQARPGPPGERVEPVRHQQRGRQQVPRVVGAAQVHAFVQQHQAAFLGIEGAVEVLRQHDAAAPDAQHDRARAGGQRGFVGVATRGQQRLEAALAAPQHDDQRRGAEAPHGHRPQDPGRRRRRVGHAHRVRPCRRDGGDVHVDDQRVRRRMRQGHGEHRHRHEQPGQVGRRRAQAPQQARLQRADGEGRQRQRERLQQQHSQRVLNHDRAP